MAYKIGQVGIKRHPHLYLRERKKVFDDVKTELKLWKTAEKIDKILDKSLGEQKDWRQLMFVFHYVMCLQGMGDDECYLAHSWMMMKTTESKCKQLALDFVGNSAAELAKKEVEK